MLDRAGTIATQWNPVMHYENITTPWPLPHDCYLNVSMVRQSVPVVFFIERSLHKQDANVPVKDERMTDLLNGHMDSTCRSTTYMWVSHAGPMGMRIGHC